MTCTNNLPNPTYVGTSVTVKCTFRPPGGGMPVDPTTVELVYVDGQGTEFTWTYLGTGAVVRSRQGIYKAALLANNAGNWSGKWIGTGACAIVAVFEFPVTALPF
jgi:hypothetical protein